MSHDWLHLKPLWGVEHWVRSSPRSQWATWEISEMGKLVVELSKTRQAEWHAFYINSVCVCIKWLFELLMVSLSVTLNWLKNIVECDVPIQFLAGSKKHKRIHWSSGSQSPVLSKLLIVWWRFTILTEVFPHQSESISSPIQHLLSFVELHGRFGNPSLLHSFLLLYRVPLTHKPEWRKQQLP